MDKDEFDAALRQVRPGQYADIPHEIFEMLFPPGVRSDDAKGAAYDYAKARGLRVEHHSELRSVWFVRDAGGEAGDHDV